LSITYQEIERKNDVVCFVATGYAWDACVFGNEKKDYWTLNNMNVAQIDHNLFDEWFQIHRPGSGLGHVDDAPMRNFLQHQWKRPCWVQKDWGDEMPVINPAIYPMDEVLETFCPRDVYGRPYPYFTNSVDYMLLLAMLRGYKTIEFYGVEFVSDVDDEYFTMRQSLNYYVGQAKAMSIDVVVQDHSSLLKAAYWYGWESKRRDHLEDIMKENLRKINTDEQELRKKLQDLKDNLNVLGGGKQSLEQLIKFASLRDKGCQI
jgi:hypothetical protein